MDGLPRLFLFLCLVLLPLCQSNIVEEEDLNLDFNSADSNWIDPFDMLSDYHTNNIKKRTTAKEEPVPVIEPVFVAKHVEKLGGNHVRPPKSISDVNGNEKSSIPIVKINQVEKDNTVSATDSNIAVKEPIEFARVPVGKLTGENGKHEKPITCNEGAEFLREKPFLRRFVQILYSTLQLQDGHISDEDPLHIPLMAKVTKKDQYVLEQIIKNSGNIPTSQFADIDEFLSNFLTLDKERWQSGNADTTLFTTQYWQPIQSWFSRSNEGFSVMSDFHEFLAHIVLPTYMLSCIIMLIIMIRRGHSVSYTAFIFYVMMFGAALLWNYFDALQNAIAKYKSDMDKYAQKPDACDPEKLGYLGVMSNYFFGDKCEMYYKTFGSPVFRVPIAEIFSSTVATIVLHPLDYVVGKLGSSFKEFIDPFPWYYQLVALAIITALSAFSLLLIGGYQIELPSLPLCGRFVIKPSLVVRDSAIDNAHSRINSVTECPELRATEALSAAQTPAPIIVGLVSDSVGGLNVQQLQEQSPCLEPIPAIMPTKTCPQTISFPAIMPVSFLDDNPLVESHSTSMPVVFSLVDQVESQSEEDTDSEFAVVWKSPP